MFVVYLVVVTAVAVAMEWVAYLAHRYVMHGVLWILHKDHHHPKGRGLQRNDLFAVFFASIAITLFAVGNATGAPLVMAVAAGITLYGIGYFLFHDVMFHRRLRGIRLRARTRYLRRIVAAHRVHHGHSGKHDGVSFGFLYAGRSFDPGP
jgi:beta-carotene 3-hydroxylase